MTLKEFAKYHAEMYGRPVEWSEAWYKSFCDCLFDVLSRDDVDGVPLPQVGTIKKDYVFPRSHYNMTTREYEERPGHMSLAFTPSSKLMEKVKALPERPEFASARKKRYRAEMPEKRMPEPEPAESQDENI